MNPTVQLQPLASPSQSNTDLMHCSGLNVSLQNLYVKILSPKVMVLGGGAFGK